MDALVIKGPAKLSGRVSISGSKNTALPLLFGSLLFDSEVRYENVPRLWDIETTLKLLGEIGCGTEWNKERGSVSVFPKISNPVASYDLVRKMRAGILALGPMIARYGEARVSLPGGCAIGARPVNYHLEAMKKMGVAVEVEDGYIVAKVPSRIRGAEIVFPDVTVTGTENLLYLAAVADGETVLENAAREPEVVATGQWLMSCGAKISGLGTSRITINGGKLLPPKEAVTVPPDRIEAGTWISIAMATGSELLLEKVNPLEMVSVIEAYRKMGLRIKENVSRGELQIYPKETYLPIQIHTKPYPGFPTDMQAQLMTNMCQATGKSVICESIFENRFMHVAELRRLGAKIEIEGNLAMVDGPVTFKAAPIMATDLRASASLVVAALRAKGETKIRRIYHLDRGYQRLDEKLRNLGAHVTRVAE